MVLDLDGDRVLLEHPGVGERVLLLLTMASARPGCGPGADEVMCSGWVGRETSRLVDEDSVGQLVPVAGET